MKKASVKFNNFFYEKDDKYHKKGEERENVNLRIAFEDLVDDRELIKKYGLDTSLKYNSHIIREVIVDGEMYEIELVKLNNNKWFVLMLLHIVDFDYMTGSPVEFEEFSLEELKKGTCRQLNLFD